MRGIAGLTAAIYARKNGVDVEVDMYQDIEKLRQHLKEISKEDAEVIDTYCEMILKIQQMNMPVEKPMGTFSSGNGAWPMGGSLAMAKRMEKCAKVLGCKIYYKQKVKCILIKETAAILN